MSEKEVFAALFLVVIVPAVSLMLISGCGEDCGPPKVMLDGTCCLDSNNDSICDAELNESGESSGIAGFNITIPETCGDGNCTGEETCRNCWHDCGPCKQIVYVYIPRNFTLSELTADIDSVTPYMVKFRKDIYNSDEVSNFFYFSRTVPRYFADFMDVKYKYLKDSRWILLNHIINENHYVNDSGSLMDYLNFTKWYRIHSIRNSERNAYEERIVSEAALDDYPTQPTGYDKEFRYEEWDYRNHTRNEHVIHDGMTLLENGMVESRYTSVTFFNVTYKFHTYFTDKYSDDNIILEDHRTVHEKYLTNIHTLNFRCARNLVITLYEYRYDGGYYDINEPDIEEQAGINRAELLRRAELIRPFCDLKYTNEVFTYT